MSVQRDKRKEECMPRWGAQETIGNVNMDKAKEDDKKEGEKERRRGGEM